VIEVGSNNRVWSIDTNTLVPYLIQKGDILPLLGEHYNISEEFHNVYFQRYNSSINFVEGVINNKKQPFRGPSRDEFFISYLALNEAFSAIREEIRCVIQFSEGFPISKWNLRRNTVPIPEPIGKEVYERVMGVFEVLLYSKIIEPLSDEPEQNGDYFSDILSSILFNIPKTETQDVILLTTAILNNADYFVTRDERLIKAARDVLLQEYDLKLLTPQDGESVLKTIRKRGKPAHCYLTKRHLHRPTS